MLHLALTEVDASNLRSILDTKLRSLHMELAHADARRFRDELRELITTVERLLEQLSPGPGGRAQPEHDPMVPRSVDDFLRDRHVSYAVIHHPAAYTARREAAAAHVTGHEWAKAVVCMADGQPTLAVVPGDHIVDREQLRQLADADEMRLATEAEISHLYWGCEVGAVPPLGPLYGQRVFLDRSMADNDEITFSAGSHRAAIRMRFRDFEELVNPTVGSFARAH